MITATLEDGSDIDINHVVTEGSSQRINGQCDIIHSHGNYLQWHIISISLLHMTIFTHFFPIPFSFVRTNKTAILFKQNYSALLVTFLLHKIRNHGKTSERSLIKYIIMFAVMPHSAIYKYCLNEAICGTMRFKII